MVQSGSDPERSPLGGVTQTLRFQGSARQLFVGQIHFNTFQIESALIVCGYFQYLTKKGHSIPKVDDIDSVSDQFNEFRKQFPVCGAIVLNKEMDQVTLETTIK
jgi:hypothetical protein